MKTLKAKYPNVWCEACNSVKPMILDEMSSDRSDHDAMDIMCSGCLRVIATVHGDSVRPAVTQTYDSWDKRFKST